MDVSPSSQYGSIPLDRYFGRFVGCGSGDTSHQEHSPTSACHYPHVFVRLVVRNRELYYVCSRDYNVQELAEANVRKVASEIVPEVLWSLVDRIGAAGTCIALCITHCGVGWTGIIDTSLDMCRIAMDFVV